ncbi:Protein of unknown function DUF2625 [Sphingobacterium nematocida]|uniref:DUF2625 domain-containing protein n=2 Tax=Sphingobacterium nematocida TaxID=1513896 RepID=A0A1T5B150_9SPHI|nr:Protein of unknown function DUF2625 [Sphingobacterium nematocida]
MLRTKLYLKKVIYNVISSDIINLKMIKSIMYLCLLLIYSATFGQSKMRSINKLISKEDPAWPLVQEWILAAKNKVEVLPVDNKQAQDALFKTQVTTRSPMGAIVYMTGGILIDDGWIRILGSGSERLNRSLPDWNKGKAFDDFGNLSPYLLIADDAIGGFYLLNGGGLGEDLGMVYYWAPDNLEFEQLGLTYTEFLSFCLNHDLNDFYKELRWRDWKKDLKNLNADSMYSFYPFLWSKEGKDINKSKKTIVSVEEQYKLNAGFRKQFFGK